MKKSEFKQQVKDEIIEILSEESVDDINKKVKATDELTKSVETLAKAKEKLTTNEIADGVEGEVNSTSLKSFVDTKLSETNKDIKSLINKWDKSEEPEKTQLMVRLKGLNKIKNELEGLL